MPNSDDVVWRLTGSPVAEIQRKALLRRYAYEHGWRPSDEITRYPGTDGFSNGHLLVEHGLDNTAVITFLRATSPFATLSWQEQHVLLAISYNNLVDWHLFPDPHGILRIYNRSQPLIQQYVSLHDDPNAWRAEAFEQATGRRPNPNLPSLDVALINTVSHWKKVLAADLGLVTSTAPIAELFNAIFFVRALEDDRRRTVPNTARMLLDALDSDQTTVWGAIEQALQALTSSPLPPDLLDIGCLKEFDALDVDTARQLFSQFYENRYYAYDFSLMSKHALSRIYEHYISVLKESDDGQKRLFQSMPREFSNRELGGIYTPQYIARFFARVLKENHTPPRFRSLRAADPACGSGIFLRTLLEMQSDPLDSGVSEATVQQAFANVIGIDVERNACKAARLSLTLLHLVLTGRFPPELQITNAEAIDYFKQRPDLARSFDAVLANPPYVRWENIPLAWQERVQAVLGGGAVGRSDLYLAFLRIGLDLVRPGGFLLFVLPHAFLIADSASQLRASIFADCWIYFIVDLSEVDVFDDASSYPILLVAQKKSAGTDTEPQATCVRCSAFAGQALQDALEGRFTRSLFYSIYSVPQATFARRSWRVLSPEENLVQEKLARFSELQEFLTVRQGLITGADEVFIRKRDDIPTDERAAYLPLLTDREMRKFSTPTSVDNYVFYPYEGDQLLEGEDIKARFPSTWAYLNEHSDVLKSRKSLNKIGKERWWRPLWPREPKNLLRPKIVGPHLMLFPRFAVDVKGLYGVSHAPLLMQRSESGEVDDLKYFVALLNSSVGHWQLLTQSHKYSRGYARIEAATLKGFRAPAPATVPPMKMQAIQGLVDRLMENAGDHEAERELNSLIDGIYGVDLAELTQAVSHAGASRNGG